MKNMSKILVAFFLLCAIFAPTQVSAQASISVDHVDSLYNGKIQPNMPLKFHIRWTNNTGSSVSGSSVGYRVYLSNNGELENGMFEPIVFDTLSLGFPIMFDLIFTIQYFSVDGIGSDTVAFGGSKLFGPGLPNGFDGFVASISTSVISDYAGDSLCIDSSFNGNAGVWIWALSGAPNVFPDWGGPYCYEILPSCCIGMRGNYNNSLDDQIDISDLVFLVNYMFLMGVPPICEEEADFNGDGNLDIADLVDLIDYMHFGGAPPVSCF